MAARAPHPYRDILHYPEGTRGFSAFRAQSGQRADLDQCCCRMTSTRSMPEEPTALPPEQLPPKTLTIGMATYDDYDGVYFSVEAIRLYHPEVTDQTEILIVDNHPDGPAAEALRNLAKAVRHCRYISTTRISGTAVRDSIFREAMGDFVLCMDSHVLFAAGSLKALIDYFEEHPDSNNLLQGPRLGDNLTDISTHLAPVWFQGLWGVWARDPRIMEPDAAPFEIRMQGLGVFACRREAWLGFNPRLRGFGGEEGYLHEKFRQAGATTICLPFLKWLHRFDRPLGPPYSVSWEDRVRNYLILFDEMGLDPAPVVRHFEKLLGPGRASLILEKTRHEIAGPFHFFDAIYCINPDSATERWNAVLKRFEDLGIAERVRRFPAIETPSNHEIGRALSQRAVIAEARKYRLRNVLVFEDEVTFVPDALERLGRSVANLRAQDWGILFLCEAACPHAVAYHESIYAKVLADVPDTPSEDGIDRYFERELSNFTLPVGPIGTHRPA
jgi:hypothetical protein